MISTVTTRREEYVGDASQTTFPYPHGPMTKLVSHLGERGHRGRARLATPSVND